MRFPTTLSAVLVYINSEYKLENDTFFFLLTGTDQNRKSETEAKQNDHTENENGTSGEDRKRKHEDTPVNGDHNSNSNSEDVKKENDGTTDVNGNEGPDAKKKKLGYIETSHKNEMVSHW